MRLINTKTKQLKEFISGDNAPPYAILSHTWEDEEVTFQDFDRIDVKKMRGYAKIGYCCNQAYQDGLEWAWIDTCCIDKSSSAELSEAINSMFRWYQKAAVCYVYLFDVEGNLDPIEKLSGLAKSRWFTRGWTLQELIAPKSIIFYSKSWTEIGTREKLYVPLSQITGIEQETLKGEPLGRVCIARRMSWAARRVTTRTEDLAYCLLGIFDVTMPLLYGEGKKAFYRLQEEILRTNFDYSIFAWGESPMTTIESYFEIKSNPGRFDESYESHFSGLLAESPLDFVYSEDVEAFVSWEWVKCGWQSKPPIIQNHEIRLEVPVLEVFYSFWSGIRMWEPGFDDEQSKKSSFIILACFKRKGYVLYEDSFLALPVLSGNHVLNGFRDKQLVLVPKAAYDLRTSNAIRAKLQNIELPLKNTVANVFHYKGGWEGSYAAYPKFPSQKSGYCLSKVHCSPSTTYDRRSGQLWCDPDSRGVDVIFLFKELRSSGILAVAISSNTNWLSPRGSTRERIEQIQVSASLLPNDQVIDDLVSSSVFEDIKSSGLRWKSMAETDIRDIKLKNNVESGRELKIALSETKEAVITTSWYKSGDYPWYEVPIIDVFDKDDDRS